MKAVAGIIALSIACVASSYGSALAFTVDRVVPGRGLTGVGTHGPTATLNVGAGPGITVTANKVGVSFAGTSCPANQYLVGFDLSGAPLCQSLIQSGSTVTLYGNVYGTGGIASGTGFTAVRNSVGYYTITFNQAFANYPGISVTPDDTVGLRIDWTITFGSFSVAFLDSANNPTDALFSFIVVGTSP